MGRHAAGEGAGVHPLVAEALRQSPGRDGVPRHGSEPGLAVAAVEEGPVGWPGDPHDGRGLGWPADTRPDDHAAVPEAAVPGDVPALVGRPARRRGWRRLFGSSAA